MDAVRRRRGLYRVATAIAVGLLFALPGASVVAPFHGASGRAGLPVAEGRSDRTSLTSLRSAASYSLGPQAVPFAAWSHNASGNLSSGSISVDAVNGTLYSANTLAGTVTSINASSGALIASVLVGPFDPGRAPISVFYLGADHVVLVGMGQLPPAPPVQGQVIALNPESLAPLELFNDSQVPGFTPVDFAYDAPTQRIFVANATGGDVGVFSSITLYEVASVRAPCPTSCPSAGLSDAPGGIIWQSDGSGVLQRLGAANLTYFAGEIPTSLPAGAGPIAILPGGDGAPHGATVWAAEPDGPALEGFNLSTGTRVGSSNASGDVTCLGSAGSVALLIAGERAPGNGSLFLQSFPSMGGSADASYPLATAASVPGNPGISSLIPVEPGAEELAIGGWGAGVDRFINVSTGGAVPIGRFTTLRTFAMAPSLQVASVWDPVSSAFVVAQEDPNALVAYNSSAGRPMWTVPLPGDPVSSLDYTADADALIVGVEGSGILEFNAGTGAAMATISPDVPGPFGLTVDASQDWLLAVNTSGNSSVALWNLSGSSPRFLAALSAPSGVTLQTVVDSGTGEGAWALGQAAGGRVMASWIGYAPIAWGASTAFTFYDPDVGASVGANGTLLLPDPDSSLVHYLPIDGGPNGSWSTNALPFTTVLGDPIQGVAFLGSNVSDDVGILDLDNGLFLGTVPTGGVTSGPALAWDPTTGATIVPSVASGAESYVGRIEAAPAPTKVTVSPGNGSANVGWTAAPEPLPVVTTGFVVAAHPVGGGATVWSNTTALAARLEGLSNGAQYSVTVAEVNAAGPGLPSSSVPVRPAGVPFPPTGTTETGSTGVSISIAWTPPMNSGGLPVTNYTVRFGAAGASGGRTVVLNATSTTLDGLTSGSAYVVTVLASNAVGEGPASAPVTVSTSGPGLFAPVGGPVGASSIGVVGLAAVVIAVWAYRRRDRAIPVRAPAES